MKTLLTLFFSVLTVAVYADEYAVAPIHYTKVQEDTAEMTLTPLPRIIQTSTDMPKTQLSTVITKPAEKPITVPLPLGPRLPHLDNPPEPDVPVATIRGQVETVDNLKGILDVPLPPAQGAIESGTIDSKLTESLAASDLSNEALLVDSELTDSSTAKTVEQVGTATSDPLGYTVLLAAMVITTIGLIYMAFVAYDYRQRWMQSLTMQNDRFLGSGMYDMEMDDSFAMRSWDLGVRS